MIKVYVEELGTYNMGISVGKWVEVSNFDSELEKIFEEAVSEITNLNYQGSFVPEEYEIVDYECEVDINLYNIYQDIESLKYLDSLLNESSDYEIKVMNYMLENGYDLKQITQDSIYEVQVYNDWDEAVEDFIEIFLDVPNDSKVYNYLDYKKVQTDLEYEGYLEINDNVFKDWN